jgi:hypothetical protein
MLDAPDPTINYHTAKDRRDAGSGEWLMGDDRYKKWKHASESLLWLHGIRTFALLFL